MSVSKASNLVRYSDHSAVVVTQTERERREPRTDWMLFRLVSARCRLSSRSPLLLSLLLLKAASPLWRPKERKEESDCHDNLPSNTHAATLHCASCFDTFGPFFPSLPLCPILFRFLGPSRSFLSDKGSIYIYFISVASKQLYIDIATKMFGCRSKE